MAAEKVDVSRWIIGGKYPTCYVDARDGAGMVAIHTDSVGGQMQQTWLRPGHARELAEALIEAAELAEEVLVDG